MTNWPLNRTEARAIKRWRTGGYTYRAVARSYTSQYGLPISDDQMLGEHLVEKAAAMLGENPRDWDSEGLVVIDFENAKRVLQARGRRR